MQSPALTSGKKNELTASVRLFPFDPVRPLYLCLLLIVLPWLLHLNAVAQVPTVRREAEIRSSSAELVR